MLDKKMDSWGMLSLHMHRDCKTSAIHQTPQIAATAPLSAPRSALTGWSNIVGDPEGPRTSHMWGDFYRSVSRMSSELARMERLHPCLPMVLLSKLNSCLNPGYYGLPCGFAIRVPLWSSIAPAVCVVHTSVTDTGPRGSSRDPSLLIVGR